ncbi:hypothetical protein V6N13_106766 [Hibiscus sabdariffa]|uniref:RNase H type-1 domain-containing protein n=1 Tax=Hibiscus sabdariffa TaxID=183260 RepID=A0ABR2F1R8_9ROSI
MYLGLHYAWEWGVRKVILEVDSADTVLAVTNRHKGSAQLSILTQVLVLVDKVWEVQVYRVPRRVNWVADGLAKTARINSLDCDYFETPLAGIDELLLVDTLEAGLG